MLNSGELGSGGDRNRVPECRACSGPPGIDCAATRIPRNLPYLGNFREPAGISHAKVLTIRVFSSAHYGIRAEYVNLIIPFVSYTCVMLGT